MALHPLPRPAFEERLHRLDGRFADSIAELHARLEALIEAPSFRYAAKPRGLPAAVVYLFSEGGRPLYVGRSNRFRQRLGNHCRRSSTPNQSAFAFRLAREEAGITEASYTGENTRKGLMKQPAFAAGFLRAKARLNEMDIQFVPEPDQVRQALLEIYCAVALATPHNDFGTH
jgi:hypothetical protein